MSHLGAYRVLKQLGEGGMASAWLAVSPTGQHVVLKIPLITDDVMAVRLRDEAQAGRRIHHPHVVSTLDFFVDAGRPVLVIEFVDGCALRDLRTRDNFRNPLPAAGVAWLGRAISEALCAIHEAKDDDGRPLGMLHRDVTASNILLDKSGAPKLIDLGIARSAENEGEKTQAGMLKGTLRYLAPELLLGEGYSASTDLWSLGVCLFEAALGRQMVAGEPVDIFRALTNGSYRTLRRGETLNPVLQDALFALLTDKPNRLRNARAAARMFAGVEAKLGPGGREIVATLVPFAQESSDDDPSAFSAHEPPGHADDFDDGMGTFAAVARSPQSTTDAPPAPPAKVVIGTTDYGTAATLQMAAVNITPPPAPPPPPAPHRSASLSAAGVPANPGPTLVLPAVDIAPPPRPVAAGPTIVLAASDVRPASSGTPAPGSPGRAPASSGMAGPTIVMPSVNPMAARVAASGDVLPEGASTLQMPAWKPPGVVEDDDDVSEEITDPNARSPLTSAQSQPPTTTKPPAAPLVSRPPQPKAPLSEEAKPTMLLPVAAALKTTRDDDD
ncbi:MAG: protein kinase [Deltaproteobacteria bacterium]|nr:protein kinase [Deltaproteobacteria bacterium]